MISTMERERAAADPSGLWVARLILSTLVADGFVGTYMGMYASAGHERTGRYADFDWFRYEIIEE